MKGFSRKLLAAAIGITLSFSLSAQRESNISHEALAGISTIEAETGKEKLKIANVDFKSLIVDEQGRVSYVINFEDDATLPYLEGSEPSDHFPNWHKPEMRRFIAAFSQHYGLEIRSITSWIGSNAITFLDDGKLDAILQDPRVKKVTPNGKVGGLEPLTERIRKWGDSDPLSKENEYSLGEITSDVLKVASIGWNIAYMGGSQTAPSNPTTIYIVDLGVGGHVNLPSTMVRVNPNNAPGYSVSAVGCYPHGLHVAGIIAGMGAQGVHGLYKGAPLVSVSILNRPTNQPCVDNSDWTENSGAEYYLAAFDYIRQDISTKQKMGVVTMSVNPLDGTALIYEGIRNLVRNSGNYKGAVFVQSAGNRDDLDHNRAACDAAFNDRNPGDGVIVVGALDSNGQPVVFLNGLSGLRNASINAFYAAGDAWGTRYDSPGSGQCIDVWAPGNEIYSTWGSVPDGTGYKQSDRVTASNYAYLSGTSMAAPHVAALAAHTIDYYGLTTPAQVEQRIRSTRVSVGTPIYNRNNYDFNQPVYVARLFGWAPPASRPTVEFAFINTYNSYYLSGQKVIRTNTSFDVVNGALKIPSSAVNVELRFDSIGAQACTVTKYFNNVSQGVVSSSVFNSPLHYGTLAYGYHRWEARCTSSNGQVNTASASVTVEQPPASACANTVPIYMSQYVSASRGHDTYITTDYSEHLAALSQGYVAAGTIGRLPSTAVANTTLFRRFYNYAWHNHIATYHASDITYLLSDGWVDDGYVGYIYTSQLTGTTPFYRLHKNHNGLYDVEHRHTTSWTEVTNLQRQGWGYDGVYGYVCP